MELPSIGDKVKKLETSMPFVRDKEMRYIPDEAHAEFWEAVYEVLHRTGIFNPPVRSKFSTKINPYFGFFGNRWDPETGEPGSFHIGIDIEGRRKTKIRAVANGILEYAGYGVINGNYIMLSHPYVRSEDGYVLHSLYMHLRDLDVKFSSYQKMLREISLRSYPQIPIAADAVIGTIGDSGQSRYPKGYVHMHFHLEFRNKEGNSIFIDPARILGLETSHNLTSDIKSRKQFVDMYVRNRKDIFERKLDAIWAPFIKSGK